MKIKSKHIVIINLILMMVLFSGSSIGEVLDSALVDSMYYEALHADREYSVEIIGKNFEEVYQSANDKISKFISNDSGYVFVVRGEMPLDSGQENSDIADSRSDEYIMNVSNFQNQRNYLVYDKNNYIKWTIGGDEKNLINPIINDGSGVMISYKGEKLILVRNSDNEWQAQKYSEGEVSCIDKFGGLICISVPEKGEIFVRDCKSRPDIPKCKSDPNGIFVKSLCGSDEFKWVFIDSKMRISCD